MIPEHCNLQRHGDSSNLLFSISQAKWLVIPKYLSSSEEKLWYSISKIFNRMT